MENQNPGHIYLLPTAKIQKIEMAIQLAQQLYALCQDDEVCAAVANMIWDENDPSEMAAENAEEFLHNVGMNEPTEMQAAFRLPNIFGELKPAGPDSEHDDYWYCWGD